MSANESNIGIYLSPSKRDKGNYCYCRQKANKIKRKCSKNRLKKKTSDPYHRKKIDQIRGPQKKTFKNL